MIAILTLMKGKGHTTRSKVTDVEVSAFSECFLFCYFFFLHSFFSESKFVTLSLSILLFFTCTLQSGFWRLVPWLRSTERMKGSEKLPEPVVVPANKPHVLLLK